MRASNALRRITRPRVSTSIPPSTSASLFSLPSAPAAQCFAPHFQSLPRPAKIGLRYQHASAVEAVKEEGVKALSPRWLSDLKARLGKCIMFGLKEEQLSRAGQILATVSKDWRELVVGSEGYLTSKDRAGLLCHNVVWGEMDSMVSTIQFFFPFLILLNFEAFRMASFVRTPTNISLDRDM